MQGGFKIVYNTKDGEQLNWLNKPRLKISDKLYNSEEGFNLYEKKDGLFQPTEKISREQYRQFVHNHLITRRKVVVQYVKNKGERLYTEPVNAYLSFSAIDETDVRVGDASKTTEETIFDTPKKEITISEPSKTTVSDIEAKKADIEKRRQEELTKIIQSIFPNTKLNEIVYHGTRTQDKFDTFDETKIGELDSGYFGRGFYFSPDKSYAEGYSKQYNGYTIAAILNLQNPLETDANKANTNISLENNDGAIVRVGENLNPELNTTEYE